MLQRDSGVRVSGKNLDIGQSLREQAEVRVREAVEKYFDGGFSSRVTVEKDGTAFRADCTVHLDTGALMRVSGTSHDPYSTVSLIVERIGKQMRRDKRKRTAHGNGAVMEPDMMNGVVTELDDDGPATFKADGTCRALVAERVEGLDTISLEDAINRMESGGLSSYVFRNLGTGRINALHDRPDGSIGWIDVAERNV